MPIASAIEVIGKLSKPNILINGHFNVMQRGTSFASGTGTGKRYLADRWYHTISNLSVGSTLTAEIVADNPDDTVSGHEGYLDTALKHTLSGSPSTTIGSNSVCHISQMVEAHNSTRIWTHGGATLSFWVKTNVQGTFCVSMRSSTHDRHYVEEFTVASGEVNNWKLVELYYPFTSKTSIGGTWYTGNVVGLCFDIILVCGTEFHTTPRTWGTGNKVATSNQVNFFSAVNNYITLSQVKLEPGNARTPFKVPFYEDELLKCERYYEYSHRTHQAMMASHAQYVWGVTSYRTRKRIAPAIALTGGQIYHPSSGWATPTSSMYASNPTVVSSAIVAVNATAKWTAARGYLGIYSLNMDAEL